MQLRLLGDQLVVVVKLLKVKGQLSIWKRKLVARDLLDTTECFDTIEWVEETTCLWDKNNECDMMAEETRYPPIYIFLLGEV